MRKNYLTVTSLTVPMKKSHFTLLLVALIGHSAHSQIIDIDYSKISNGFVEKAEEDPVEVLSNGFVDYVSNGSIQSSARLLRINIGERDKFYIPFFIYTGTAGKAFGEQDASEIAVSNLLNPISGTVNLSFHGTQNLVVGSDLTKLKLAYQLGGRFLGAGREASEGTVSFLNTFGNAGFFFQTEAWNPDQPENMGVAFLQVKLLATFSSEGVMDEIFEGNDSLERQLFGYSVDGGIEIDQTISLKLGVYQFFTTSVDALNNPLIKFSIDYSFGK